MKIIVFCKFYTFFCLYVTKELTKFLLKWKSYFSVFEFIKDKVLLR